MTQHEQQKFTVIENNNYIDKERIRQRDSIGNSAKYQTNPFYERLVKFSNEKSRKKFTVEDLLKW